MTLQAVFVDVDQPTQLAIDFQAACDKLRFRSLTGSRPRLATSDAIEAPISFGCLKPVVMLPTSLTRNRKYSEIAIAHELAHLRRFDSWFNSLQNLLLIVWWFNPVLWVLNWQIRKVREDCCDDLVLGNKFVNGESYSQALIEIAKLSNRKPTAIQTTFCMAEHPLKDRIRRIMNPSLRWRILRHQPGWGTG